MEEEWQNVNEKSDLERADDEKFASDLEIVE